GFQLDALREVPLSDGADDAGHLFGGADQVADEGVEGADPGRPGPAGGPQRGALVDPPLLADHRADPVELPGAVLQQLGYLVKGLGDGGVAARLVGRQPDREIAVLDAPQGGQEVARLDGAVFGEPARHGTLSRKRTRPVAAGASAALPTGGHNG